jgi:hypothetical protein
MGGWIAFIFSVVLSGLPGTVASLMSVQARVPQQAQIAFHPNQASVLEPPEGVLALREGGYALAEYADVFDGFGKEGCTVELWFYLTDVPSDWKEVWVLIDKPHSYFIHITGIEPVEFRLDPEVVGYIKYMVYCGDGGAAGSRVWLSPENFSLNRWFHFAYQIRGTGPIQSAEFFDGRSMGTGSSDSAGGFLASSDPLFIGGREGHKSIKGWIDEIRISRGWRYTPRQPINPPRKFDTDQQTLALWHFDEGPWAPHYADASGNGHTLFSVGLTPVEAEQAGKLAAMWGRLKTNRK